MLRKQIATVQVERTDSSTFETNYKSYLKERGLSVEVCRRIKAKEDTSFKTAAKTAAMFCALKRFMTLMCGHMMRKCENTSLSNLHKQWRTPCLLPLLICMGLTVVGYMYKIRC